METAVPSPDCEVYPPVSPTQHIDSFSKCLPSTFYRTGTATGSGSTEVERTKPLHSQLTFSCRRQTTGKLINIWYLGR